MNVYGPKGTVSRESELQRETRKEREFPSRIRSWRFAASFLKRGTLFMFKLLQIYTQKIILENLGGLTRY